VEFRTSAASNVSRVALSQHPLSFLIIVFVTIATELYLVVMLQQLEYDPYVGREVLERRDTHDVCRIFLILIFRSTICQNQHSISSFRLVTVNITSQYRILIITELEMRGKA